MGAWGNYDDQDDSSYDAWTNLMDKIEHIPITEQKKIFKITEKEMDSLDAHDGTGLFLIVCEYVNGRPMNGDFYDRIPKINETFKENPNDPEVLETYLNRFRLDDPHVVSKSLIKKLIMNTEELFKEVFGYRWGNQDERITALKNERVFFRGMLDGRTIIERPSMFDVPA